MSKPIKTEAHVRLYKHELESPAYRSLSPDARALLIELRALYKGAENRVFLSRGQIEKRLGVGRFKAENARDQLIDRGFIIEIEPASFKRKVPHAPAYRLTNEPVDPQRDGATASKEYMRWRPHQENLAGRVTNPAGADDSPRAPAKTPKNQPLRVGHQPRRAAVEGETGVSDQPTDKLPGGAGSSEAEELIKAALSTTDEAAQAKLCIWTAAILQQSEEIH